MRAVITAAAVSTVLCLVGWVAFNASGLQEYDEHDTGVAIREVAEPGRHPRRLRRPGRPPARERLPSPYAYLWSLPMRTLDPDLAELDALVTGRRPADLDRRVGGLPALGRPDGARLAQLVEERLRPRGHRLRRPADLAAPRRRPGAPRQPDCHGSGFEFSSGP